MKINGLTPVYFTGFSAWDDEFICSAALSQNAQTCVIDRSIFGFINENEKFKTHWVLITWNGENHRGCFNFPWLRSKCIQKGIDWQLSGVKHLDLLPLVRKYLNTTGYKPPSKSDLYADDMKRLAEANGIEYSNKSQAYEELEQMDNVDCLDYEQQPNEDNSLQSVYQKLFDPEQEEEYIDGERIPELYYQLVELNLTEQEIDEIWKQIKSHNRRDVERLKKVAEAVIPLLPDWEIERNIKEL